jgi:hypothetical protein
VIRYEHASKIKRFVKEDLKKLAKEIQAEAKRLVEEEKYELDEATEEVNTRYRKELESKYTQLYPMSDAEIVNALSKYVEVVRHWTGRNGVKPFATGQEKDVPQGAYLIAQNPMHLSIQNSAFKDKPGMFPAANGGPFMFDEFGRFPASFRDLLLSYIESGKLSLNGSNEFFLDIYLFLAANTESVKKLEAEEKPNPMLDRTAIRNFLYQIFPREIAKTFTHMKGKNQIEMAPLDDLKNTKPLEISTVWPIEGTETPTGRYVLTYNISGNGKDILPRRVIIEPHTTEYMSEVAALTRMVFNPNDAAAAGVASEHAVRPEFRDPFIRLRIVTGELPVEPSVVHGLSFVSTRVKEGSFGITNRDIAEKWFTAMITKVTTDPSKAFSPSLARTTLNQLLNEGKINFGGNNETRDAWQKLAKEVLYQRVIPKYEQDLVNLQTEDPDAVYKLYDEVYAELLQVGDDYNTLDRYDYVDEQGERVAVNLDRLRGIAEIYQANTGDVLNVRDMIKFSTQNLGKGANRSKKLLEAIQRYRASINTLLLSTNELLQALQNSDNRDPESAERARKVAVTANRAGYSKAGLMDMLNEIKVVKNNQK